MGFVTRPPDIDVEDGPVFLWYLQNGTCIAMTTGASPEGVVNAGISTLLMGSNGVAWFKTTGIGILTGWVQVILSGSAVAAGNVPTRLIETLFTNIGNVGAGLDQLHVTTAGLGSFSLQNDQDYIEIITAGLYANNANTKRYVISIAGVGNILDTGLVAVQNRFWQSMCRIARISATSVRCIATHLVNNNAGVSAIVVNQADFAVADLNANSIFPQSQGESGAAASNDVTENFWEVTAYRRQP